MSFTRPEDDDFKELHASKGSLSVNMASPMQDMVISSTVTSVNSPSNKNEQSLHGDTINDPSENEFRKSRVFPKRSHCLMRHSIECCTWMSDFDKGRCRLVGSTNYKHLKHFLTVYAENITKDAFMWKKKLEKLAALKTHISNVLMYYHWYFHCHAEKTEDNLQKISDILVVYVNLELKLFKKAESEDISVDELSSLLINKLWIYLGNSEKHILRVVFKSKLPKKHYSKICLAILQKCFENILIHKPNITAIEYIRYSIALKLWKSICNDQEYIENVAVKILGTTTPAMNSDGLHFFPLPPNKCTNHTSWYLKTKCFDFDSIVGNFLEFEIDYYGLSNDDEVNLAAKAHNCCHLNVDEKSSLKTVQKRSKLQKQYYLERKKSLATGEVIFVDLTEEDGQKLNKKNLKRKENLKWLSNIKKKKLMDSTNSQCLDYEKIFDISTSSLPMNDHRVTESYKLETLHSSHKNCDNITFNDNPILSYSNDIFENSDITRCKKVENSELSKESSIFSELFDDNICDMSIDINLLHKESDTFSSPDLMLNSKNELSFLLDSDLSDSSLNILEAVDPCAIRRNYKENNSPTKTDISFNNVRKDSLLMNIKDRKHQLLIDVTDFGLLEAQKKTSILEDEESLITSTEEPSSLFVFKRNSEIELDEFSKTPFFDEHFITDQREYSLSFSDTKDSKKSMLDKSGKETSDILIKCNDQKAKSTAEKKKIRSRSNRPTSLKIKASPALKIKSSTEDLLWSEREKLEGGNGDSLPEPKKNFTFSIKNFSPQKFHKKTNSFKKLANYIQNSGMNKVVTVFDSSSSTMNQSKSYKEKPSTRHYFIRLLFEKGLLLRHYTRNKGKLERFVGIVSEKLIVLPDQDIFPESLNFQVERDISEAHFLIFFTNNYSSVTKWFKGNCPKLFVFQEKKPEELHSTLNDVQISNQSKVELIRVESHDIGCQFLSDELGWNEELKKCNGLA